MTEAIEKRATLRLLREQYHRLGLLDGENERAISAAVNDFDEFRAIVSCNGFSAFGGEYQLALDPPESIADLPDRTPSLPTSEARRSVRCFNREPVPLSCFTMVLREALASKGGSGRSYPSAGACYSVDLFAVSLPQGRQETHSGLYRLDFDEWTLVKVPGIRVDPDRLAAALDKFSAHFENPSIVCFYMIHKRRAVQRYLSLGIRFALMEVGSMYQVLSQSAWAGGIGSCLFGAARDRLVNEALGLSSADYFFCLAHFFGYVRVGSGEAG